MLGKKKQKVATKPPVELRSQEKFGKGRDWSGFDAFRAEYPTAPGGETWESYEDGLFASRSLTRAQETIRDATYDRRAAIGR